MYILNDIHIYLRTFILTNSTQPTTPKLLSNIYIHTLRYVFILYDI